MRTLKSTIIFTAGIPLAGAQFLFNHTIGSCADVDCPGKGDNTTSVECRVTNRTYGLIGLDTFETTITESNGDLTWTVGTHVYDDVEPDDARVIEKDFYLGTPSELNLTANDLPFQGCAIFLYGNEMEKPEDDQPWECENVVGVECKTQLLDDATQSLGATQTQNSSESVENVCRHLEQRFNSTFTAPCGRVTGHDQWGGIRAVPLTGQTAPAPASASQNESSNCHPTLPKSNDLTFIYGYNDTGTVWLNDTQHMFFAVNLIVTIFWSPDKNVTGALEEPDSQLSCLWPVDMNDESLRTMNPGRSAAARPSAFGIASFAPLVAIGMHMI